MTAIFDFKYMDREAFKKLKEAKFSDKGSKRLCFHENTDSEMHVMLIELKSNTIYKTHKHTTDEVMFLQKGEITITFSDEVITLSENGKTLIIIEKNREHSVKAGKNGAIILEFISHRK